MTIIIIKFAGNQKLLKVTSTFNCLLPSYLRHFKVLKINQILLFKNNNFIQVGTPFLNNQHILLKVKQSFKSKKIIIFKTKIKNNYKKIRGFRAVLTKVVPLVSI